jgi:hypothetical protein
MISANPSFKDATESNKGKGEKEKAPQFKEAVDRHLLFIEGHALLYILSCPPLLTREKAVMEGSKKNAT